MLAWVDWRLCSGALCLVPGVYYSDLLWNRRIRPLFRDVRKQRQEIDARPPRSSAACAWSGRFGRQRSESARFMGENHFMTRQELFAWWLSRLIELLWDFILPMASVALLLYGGLQVLDGRLSLGDLMMFLVYLAMLLEPMAVLATSVTQFQNNLVGLRPGARPPGRAPRDGRLPGPPARPQDIRWPGGSRSRTSSFAYPGHRRRCLRDIDLDVEPGETIALVGRSGSGKTTLCNLIARFYDPTAGDDPARRRRPPRDRGRELPPAAGDRRAGRLPVRRHDRREHRLWRPRATHGRDRTRPPGPPTQPSSSSACPTATTP